MTVTRYPTKYCLGVVGECLAAMVDQTKPNKDQTKYCLVQEPRQGKARGTSKQTKQNSLKRNLFINYLFLLLIWEELTVVIGEVNGNLYQPMRSIII